MICIKEILSKIHNQGEIHIDPRSKAELIHPIPEINIGYLHELFPGLSEEEIALIKQSYNGELPEEFLDFLRLTNGANLFGRSLRICGMPYDPIKFQDCKLPTPIYFATSHRTCIAPKEYLFFGSYKKFGEEECPCICFDLSDPKEGRPIYCIPRHSNTILKSWDSFEEWFCEEYFRFLNLYVSGRFEIKEIVKGIIKDIYFES